MRAEAVSRAVARPSVVLRFPLRMQSVPRRLLAQDGTSLVPVVARRRMRTPSPRWLKAPLQEFQEVEGVPGGCRSPAPERGTYASACACWFCVGSVRSSVSPYHSSTCVDVGGSEPASAVSQSCRVVPSVRLVTAGAMTDCVIVKPKRGSDARVVGFASKAIDGGIEPEVATFTCGSKTDRVSSRSDRGSEASESSVFSDSKSFVRTHNVSVEVDCVSCNSVRGSQACGGNGTSSASAVPGASTSIQVFALSSGRIQACHPRDQGSFPDSRSLVACDPLEERSVKCLKGGPDASTSIQAVALPSPCTLR